MKKKMIGYSGILFTLLASVIWLSQGCTGGVPPLALMVVTATYTLTPIPTPSYPLCAAPQVNPPYLIDDMEDNTTQILTNQCRTGYWYNYSDGTGGGVQNTGGSPGPFKMANTGVGTDGTGTSTHSVEISTNSGFTNYGAGFGFAFLNPQGNYNAFGYHGIQFYGKNTTGTVAVSFAVTDNDVVNAIPAYSIGPHSVGLAITTSWTLYQVSMAQLIASANGYGGPTTFDPSRIQQVQWSVGAGIASDIWIDNVSFY